MSWSASDPQALLLMALHSSSTVETVGLTGGYSNLLLDQLIEESNSQTDEALRTQVVKEAQRVAFEEQPWLFLFDLSQVLLLDERVSGAWVAPDGGLRMATMRIE